MSQPIESAADLHRELTKHGLQLRPRVGRDAALVSELANKLGIPPTRFSSSLKSSRKTAEDYLRALMAVAEPFARMFREIWTYLARHCAPKAGESLVIRFGFSGDTKEIDWEQFRVIAETVKKVRSFGPVLLWPAEGLFQLARLLLPLPSGRHAYNKGQAFELTPIQGGKSFDKIGQQARSVIQSLIDQIHIDWVAKDAKGKSRDDWDKSDFVNVRHLPELKSSLDKNFQQPAVPTTSSEEFAYLLADLIPAWGEICEHWSEIPTSDKRKAEEYFREHIEPLLKSTEAPVWRRLRQALDLLDLPFWRYRWHTYEVWASVKALEGLEEFHPQPVVRAGHLAIDAASPALIAKLTAARQVIYAHVQGETKLSIPFGERKAIKPDLRFSIDDPSTNPGTVTIVEFKQRAELDTAHVSEVLAAYSQGAGMGGGVVLINYDAMPTVSVPPLCTLLGNVQPAQPGAVREYQAAVRASFQRAGIFPRASKRFVLLDISGSMESKYSSDEAQLGLKRLMELSWVKVFRFNDGLVSGGDLKTFCAVSTGGGTELGTALEQLFALPEAGIPERLVIVTDGDHDHPKRLLAKVGAYIECQPHELASHLHWLMNP